MEHRSPWKGGNFLEEQEVVDHFPELSDLLGQNRPDFVLVRNGVPVAIIETKNDFSKLDIALSDGKAYANAIYGLHEVDMVIGIAGSPDTAVRTRTHFWHGEQWMSLTSHGYELTQILTP